MARGILWSQHSKLVIAGNAINGWQDAAIAAGMHIDQLNIRIHGINDGDPAANVVFEWDEGAGEYVMRTGGE